MAHSLWDTPAKVKKRNIFLISEKVILKSLDSYDKGNWLNYILGFKQYPFSDLQNIFMFTATGS